MGTQLRWGSRLIKGLWVSGRGGSDEPEPIAETGLWRIRNVFVDLYAGRDERGVVLFDTGIDPRGRPVDRLLAALDAQRSDVHTVLLTHAHPDHVAAVPLFPHARIFLGAADRERLEGRVRGRTSERWFKRLLPTPRAQATDLLEGSKSLELGSGTCIDAFSLPGDTPGAYAYYWRCTLIVGDAMDLRDGRLEPAMAFATDDADLNLRSIASLPDLLGDRPLDFVASSHGGITPVGQAWTLLREVAERAGRSRSARTE